MPDITRKFRRLRKNLYVRDNGKEEMKALAGGLPSSTELLSAFQYLEDEISGSMSTWRGQLATKLGKGSITAALNKKIVAAYLQYKFKDLRN